MALNPNSDRSALHQLASRRMKDILLFGVYPHAYRQAARKPVDLRKVVFIESKLREMPDAFKLVWERLEQTGRYDLSYLTLGQAMVGFTTYTKNCLAMVKDIADAAYVFLCDANDIVSCVPLRPETKIVQLWHACGAFKKWGMSTGDKKFGGTSQDIVRHPYYSNLSLVTVSASEVRWAYIEAMQLEKTSDIVQAVGVSRTDVFFDSGFLSQAEDAVRQAVPGIAGRKIILYSPTFRGHVREAVGPDSLDIRAMREALGGEYALLVKHHPYVKNPPVIPPGCEDFAFEITHAGLPIDKLLACADVCITDYSSIVFEYSLFLRPMAFFAPDISDYDDWRGFYYDYDELTPGPVFSQTEPLVAWIRGLAAGFDDAQMRAFRDKFMSACDGHATERILQAVGALPAVPGEG